MEVRLRGVGHLLHMFVHAERFVRRDGPGIVAEALVEDAVLRLEDDETAPSGKRWERWSTNYAETRPAGSKILFDDGDLAESLAAVMTDSAAEVVSDLPYAAVHQEGSRDGRIKARPYVGVGDDAKVAIADVLPSEFERSWVSVR